MSDTFLDSLLRLKCVPRQGWIDRLQIHNPESVADHSYSVAAMSMLLADAAGLDTERVIRMALVHDLAESLTGDMVPGSAAKESKRALEDGAMREILQDVPGEQRLLYLRMWDEYQRNETQEAQFLHQVDKLEMALQADRYLQDGAAPEAIMPFLDTADRKITNPDLRKIFNMLLVKHRGWGHCQTRKTT